jgi:hypothetical protein
MPSASPNPCGSQRRHRASRPLPDATGGLRWRFFSLLQIRRAFRDRVGANHQSGIGPLMSRRT